MKAYKKYLFWFGIFVFLITFDNAAAIIFRIAGYILSGIGLFLAFALIFILCSLRISQRRLKQFRKKNEGKYFLWYSSNKRLKAIIEKELRSLLDMNYQVIYTNRNNIETALSEEEWKYLRAETDTLKFPRLIKIQAGKVIAQSFFSEVNLIRQFEQGKKEYQKTIITKLNKLKNE